MLIRHLTKVHLKKQNKEKQPNGIYISNYQDVSDYTVIKQFLESEVDIQTYGSSINKMLRFKSPYNSLENYLYNKLNNSDDNVSSYIIFDDVSKYKIIAVTPYKVDVEKL